MSISGSNLERSVFIVTILSKLLSAGDEGINPALTHLLVNDPSGLDRWMRVDSYNGSQECRSMRLLAGKSAAMPNIPVRRDDAIRRLAFWNDRFFSLVSR
jgi:hypothetical protein